MVIEIRSGAFKEILNLPEGLSSILPTRDRGIEVKSIQQQLKSTSETLNKSSSQNEKIDLAPENSSSANEISETKKVEREDKALDIFPPLGSAVLFRKTTKIELLPAPICNTDCLLTVYLNDQQVGNQKFNKGEVPFFIFNFNQGGAVKWELQDTSKVKGEFDIQRYSPQAFSGYLRQQRRVILLD